MVKDRKLSRLFQQLLLSERTDSTGCWIWTIASNKSMAVILDFLVNNSDVVTFPI